VIGCGRTKNAYGRELPLGDKREEGQIEAPEDRLIRVEKPELRIVDVALAPRVDAVRLDKLTRYVAGIKTNGRMPERSHGK
jgi:hypothetical protein